jgi:hypothetical protein
VTATLSCLRLKFTESAELISLRQTRFVRDASASRIGAGIFRVLKHHDRNAVLETPLEDSGYTAVVSRRERCERSRFETPRADAEGSIAMGYDIGNAKGSPPKLPAIRTEDPDVVMDIAKKGRATRSGKGTEIGDGKAGKLSEFVCGERPSHE